MADAATEFAALSYALREAGETGLKRELDKALGDAARPLAAIIGDVRHLREFMPSPYAGVLAGGMRVAVRRRSTGANPAVEVVDVSRRRIRRLNTSGVLAHPLFGNRRHWYNQSDGVTPGFFDRPVEEARPQVRAQIEEALDRVRNKIYAAR